MPTIEERVARIESVLGLAPLKDEDVPAPADGTGDGYQKVPKPEADPAPKKGAK